MSRVQDVVCFFQESRWRLPGLAAVLALHFVCFYWWVSDGYHFTGDGLFYFSRRITSFAALWLKFISLDDLYQYRPLPYVVFSFILYPLFGTEAGPYHLAAYIIALVNILLVCACCYFWLGGDAKRTWIASLFLILNPVNFFPSYGLTYIDVLLSVLFYLLALILILANTRRASLLAPALAALALLSREQAVLLPVQALLILLAMGIPWRQAISRTRNVWLVVAAYAVFQLIIRQGGIFAPETANPNLQFGLSLERVELLVKGFKPAIYFPETTYLGALQDYRRIVRLAFVIPWIGIIGWVLFRRERASVSSLIWIPLSLLPIAFIQFPPFARHYYLALPGLAILFSSVIRSTRAVAYISSILALVTLTSVGTYAQDSWIAAGSQRTRKYFKEINSIVEQSGRKDFYVLNEGDQFFYWNIDGGTPLREFLGKEVSFRFASSSAALEMDALLDNSVNVVIPTLEKLYDAMETRRFPHFEDRPICTPIRRLTGSESECAVFFRGLPLIDERRPVVETPNGMPIVDLGDEIVILSRTTVFLAGRHIRFNAHLTAARESADGMTVKIFSWSNGKFDRKFERHLAPGEQFHLQETFDVSRDAMLVLRVAAGPGGNEQGDWLIWKTPPEKDP